MFPHRPKSLAGSAGLALLALTTLSGLAPADTFYETVYLPTSSIVSLPTSNLLATSYVVPTSNLLSTSYVVPTSYTSTVYPTSFTSSYLASDSVLVPTSTTYYRPSIFRPRRYVERTSYSYLPTSTILPTSYVVPSSYSYIAPTSFVSSSMLMPTSYLIDRSVVTTSMDSLPCETAPSVAPTRAMNKPQTSSGGGNGPTVVSEPTNLGTGSERKPSAMMNSTPSGEGTPSSAVEPPVTVSPPAPKEAPKPADATPLAEPPPLGTGTGTAPKPPVPAASPGTGTGNEVVVPAAGQLGNPANPNEMSYKYQARRPSYDTRNILRGRVISAETKRPEEGVTVIVSSLTKQFTDRPAMTDADGEFKVSLPDGDWTVKVKMPSGTIFSVGRDYVTASNGKVTDASGRNVAEFLISR